MASGTMDEISRGSDEISHFTSRELEMSQYIIIVTNMNDHILIGWA